MPIAYTASQIFTGIEWLTNHAVICEDESIIAIVPTQELSDDVTVTDLGSQLLAPALIDAQVYGASGRLFSLFPTVDTLQQMQEAFTQQGTCLFQPTVATNTSEVFRKCIDAVRQYKDEGRRGVHGLHLEGPWLNPQKGGAHVKEWMHAPTITEVEELIAYGQDVITMITLAPELCSQEVIKLLLQHKIVLSAGHSNARYAEGMQGFENGITTATHLFNAMSPLHHREPGLVGAVLQHPSVMGSVIPDGHHVDYAAIAIAKRAMGSRLFVITDAVTTTTEGPYQHYLAGDKYECNGTLSRSAISMHQAFVNLVQQVGIDKGEALRMCSLYPAKALQIDNRYGRIAEGYKASLLFMNEDFSNPGLLSDSGIL